MNKKKREAYLELIKRGVAKLVAKGKVNAIADVMEHTGYLCNLSDTPFTAIGDAIIGLAAVIPDVDLAAVLTGVVFQCEIAGIAIENDNRDARSRRWNRACAMGEMAVRTPEILL